MGFLQRKLKVWNEFIFRDKAFREKISFFRKVFLFEKLGQRSIALVANRMVKKNYAPEEIVFQEGDVGRACFVVAEGRVELFRQNGNAKGKKVLTVLEKGDFFGEMVLLDELPRSATAKILTPATLYILYKSNFDSLVINSPKAGAKILYNLARLLSARLRKENSKELSVL